jgi:regulator of protease activity HflC (stomatin/prohibitin superfamily)
MEIFGFGIGFITIAVVVFALYALSSIKILAEYERGVIFRLGRLLSTAKGPGVAFVFAPLDRMVRVSLRQEALEVPPQDIITRDNVTLKVNAVIFLRVIDPNKAVVEVSTRLRNSPRLLFAPCLASRSSTNCFRTARKLTCACKAFSTSTLRPGA